MPKGHTSQTVKIKPPKGGRLPNPPPCQAVRYEPDRWVNLSTVARDQRAETWQQIQDEHPALADMLQNDENWKALRERFGGGVLVVP